MTSAIAPFMQSTASPATSDAAALRRNKPLKEKSTKGLWSHEEHDRFLAAIKRYPKGPWKAIADHVGSRSVRQVQTHAQKYQEKVSRRLRGLRKFKKKLVRPEHRLDEATMELCKLVDSTVEKLAESPLSPSDDSLLQHAWSHAAGSPQLHVSVSSELAPLPTVLDISFSPISPEQLPTFTESLDFLIQYLSS
ncbi:TPA: hypothetical protein N0F65_001996 [Lagenidium giganteum]|uniref:Uncharacterized protein n=1 Tax=Lagenidium giganteum TaxID=4803 RepID=A0AAV2YZ65_9STRA|nr:TPA: hypothetical protein N0F65_001996 [Lagenidium giganteum]